MSITIVSSDNIKFNVNECDLIRYSGYFKVGLKGKFKDEKTFIFEDFSSKDIGLFIEFIDNDGYLEKLKDVNESVISLGEFLVADKFLFNIFYLKDYEDKINNLRGILNAHSRARVIKNSDPIESYANDGMFSIFPSIYVRKAVDGDSLLKKHYIAYIYDIYDHLEYKTVFEKNEQILKDLNGLIKKELKTLYEYITRRFSDKMSKKIMNDLPLEKIADEEFFDEYIFDLMDIKDDE